MRLWLVLWLLWLLWVRALLAASVYVVAGVAFDALVLWDTSSGENSGWTQTCSACRTRIDS
jgi:hypothetical protein